METSINKQNNEQENYIVKKLKSVKSKLYQAYLIPFSVDFTFRIGAAILSGFVGSEAATIIGISVLSLTRIKAVKDLFDVTKGLVETEKLHDPTLTIKKMFARDFKVLINSIISRFKFKNNGKKDKSQTNSILIILGALAPMLFDYFSMGIAATHGATGVVVTQSIDTMLHVSSLIILFSNVKKINEKLRKFNIEYYNPFKSFVNESLILHKQSFGSKIKDLFNHHNLKDILDKDKTNQSPEKIRRFLINSKNVDEIIKKATNSQELEQFYLQFPNDVDYAERSIRKYGDKYVVVTKIIETDESNELGSPDLSRETYTVEITEKRYKEFLKLNGNNPIYKLTCYTIPINNVETTILLDVYKDMFKGLNIARVKFKDSEESLKFIKPKWFGNEITTNPDYTGKHFPIPKNN